MTYLAGAELPCVVVNMVRGGPGLGSIQPSQGDYFQATRGGGHGDYHPIVLAPASVQETVDLIRPCRHLPHSRYDSCRRYHRSDHGTR